MARRKPHDTSLRYAKLPSAHFRPDPGEMSKSLHEADLVMLLGGKK